MSKIEKAKDAVIEAARAVLATRSWSMTDTPLTATQALQAMRAWLEEKWRLLSSYGRDMERHQMNLALQHLDELIARVADDEATQQREQSGEVREATAAQRVSLKGTARRNK